MASRRINILRRSVERFEAQPASIRNATIVIGVVTATAVLVGSLFMWLLAEEDFPDFWTALWFTLQTVTTVGYGDVTPATAEGRVMGGIMMVIAIAFLTTVTALITSTFVQAARRRDLDIDREQRERMHGRIDELHERLSSIEASIARLEAGAGAADRSREGAPAAGVTATTPDDQRADPDDGRPR